MLRASHARVLARLWARGFAGEAPAQGGSKRGGGGSGAKDKAHDLFIQALAAAPVPPPVEHKLEDAERAKNYSRMKASLCLSRFIYSLKYYLTYILFIRSWAAPALSLDDGVVPCRWLSTDDCSRI